MTVQGSEARAAAVALVATLGGFRQAHQYLVDLRGEVEASVGRELEHERDGVHHRDLHRSRTRVEAGDVTMWATCGSTSHIERATLLLMARPTDTVLDPATAGEYLQDQEPGVNNWLATERAAAKEYLRKRQVSEESGIIRPPWWKVGVTGGGQGYDPWSPDPYPAGNVLRGWRYDRSMFTVLAIDFGRYNPAVLVLAKDPKIGWVICGEVNPRGQYTKTPELADLILRVAWPRYLEHLAPVGENAPRFFFDDAVADPGGGQQRASSRTGELEDSDLQILGEMPAGLGPEGHQGIGFRPRVLTGKGDDYLDRRNPRSGILRVHRAIGRREILIDEAVYELGLRAEGRQRSFARSIFGFRYGANGEPARTEGHDHILDALRYFVRDDVSGLWGFHPTFGRGIGRPFFF